jgi:hypothetical protein
MSEEEKRTVAADNQANIGKPRLRMNHGSLPFRSMTEVAWRNPVTIQPCTLMGGTCPFH